MPTTQLNVRVPLELAEQLRQAATQQGRGVGTVVAQALTASLAGASSQAPEVIATDSSALATQLAAVEQRLLALEQGRPASPKRVKPAPLPAEPATPKRVAPPRSSGVPITTAELAELLAMRRGTLNARISRAGGPVVGQELNGWCCVALEVPSRGGPARALWQAST